MQHIIIQGFVILSFAGSLFSQGRYELYYTDTTITFEFDSVSQHLDGTYTFVGAYWDTTIRRARTANRRNKPWWYLDMVKKGIYKSRIVGCMFMGYSLEYDIGAGFGWGAFGYPEKRTPYIEDFWRNEKGQYKIFAEDTWVYKEEVYWDWSAYMWRRVPELGKDFCR